MRKRARTESISPPFLPLPPASLAVHSGGASATATNVAPNGSSTPKTLNVASGARRLAAPVASSGSPLPPEKTPSSGVSPLPSLGAPLAAPSSLRLPTSTLQRVGRETLTVDQNEAPRTAPRLSQAPNRPFERQGKRRRRSTSAVAGDEGPPQALAVHPSRPPQLLNGSRAVRQSSKGARGNDSVSSTPLFRPRRGAPLAEQDPTQSSTDSDGGRVTVPALRKPQTSVRGRSSSGEVNDGALHPTRGSAGGESSIPFPMQKGIQPPMTAHPIDRRGRIAFQTLQDLLRRTSLAELKDKEIAEWLQGVIDYLEEYSLLPRADDGGKPAELEKPTRGARQASLSPVMAPKVATAEGPGARETRTSPPLAPLIPQRAPSGYLADPFVSAPVAAPHTLPAGAASELRFLILGVLHTMPWWRFADLSSTGAKVSSLGRQTPTSLKVGNPITKWHRKILFAFEMLCLRLLQSSPHAVRGVLEVLLRPFHMRPPVRDGVERLVPLDSMLRLLNSTCAMYPSLVLALTEQCFPSLVPKRRWRNQHHHQSCMRVLLFLALEAEVPSYESSWQDNYNNPYGRLTSLMTVSRLRDEKPSMRRGPSDFCGDAGTPTVSAAGSRAGSMAPQRDGAQSVTPSTRTSLSLQSVALPSPMMSDSGVGCGHLSDSGLCSEGALTSSSVRSRMSSSSASLQHAGRAMPELGSLSLCRPGERDPVTDGGESSEKGVFSGRVVAEGTSDGSATPSGLRQRSLHRAVPDGSLYHYYTSDTANPKQMLARARSGGHFSDSAGPFSRRVPQGAIDGSATASSFAAYAHQQQQGMSLNNKMLSYRNELIRFILQKLSEMELTLERAQTHPDVAALGVAGAATGSGMVCREEVWRIIGGGSPKLEQPPQPGGKGSGTCKDDDEPVADPPLRAGNDADPGLRESRGGWQKTVLPGRVGDTCAGADDSALRRAEAHILSAVSQHDGAFACILTNCTRITYQCLAEDLLRQLSAGVCGNAEWWRELLNFHFDIIIKMEQPLVLLYLAPSLALLGNGEEAVDLMHKLISLVTKGVQPLPPRRALPSSTGVRGSGSYPGGAAGLAGGRMMMPPPRATMGGGSALVSMEMRVRAAKHIFPLFKFMAERLGSGESTRRRLLKWVAAEMKHNASISGSSQFVNPIPSLGEPSELVQVVFAQCIALGLFVGQESVDSRGDIPKEALAALLVPYDTKRPSDDCIRDEALSTASTDASDRGSIRSMNLASAVTRGYLLPELMSCCPWNLTPCSQATDFCADGANALTTGSGVSSHERP